jgi:CRISPR-associated protein Cas1
MGMRSETINLLNPDISTLPRANDQITFLHLFAVKVTQDDTGVLAVGEDENGQPLRTYLPVASIAAILLGPGVSISQAALSTITKHGTVILWTNQDATRTNGWAYPLTTSSRWIEAQAKLWADPKTRTQVAIAMYEKRFGSLPPGGKITLARLRGLEGQRMKQLYRDHSKKTGITFKRDYKPDNFDEADPINQALSAANSALYGVSMAATVAIGCHPGLGFVHAGNINSFVHDIADLYKADISIPAAFKAATRANPASEARRLTREAMVKRNTLAAIVNDIQDLLKDGLEHASPADSLHDDNNEFVPSHTNYSETGTKNEEAKTDEEN